jgi:glycolate oxidase FAD binding subunit
MTSGVDGALAEFLPDEAILDDVLLRSGLGGSSRSLPLVAPFSEDQVAQVMARASLEGWRVLPAGLGTWLEGGGTPDVDLVLSIRNLREIESYEPADLTFSTAAGIPWADLQKITRAHGQWLPLDPPGVEEGSLGGLAATGVSGPLRQAYGAPRDHVLGVRMVSGDGRILNWGGRVVKNVAGFDVTRLMLGSWGALGVITSVSARLFPVPEEDVTLLVHAPRCEDLLPEARGLATSPIPLSALDLLDPGPSGEAALAIRLLGSRAQVREMEGRIRANLGAGLSAGGGSPSSTVVLRGEESRGLYAELGRWEDGANTVLRMSLLPSKLGTLVEEARTLARLVEASVELPGPQGPKQGAEAESLAAGWSNGGTRLCGHVGWGVLRLAFPKLGGGPGGSGALAKAISEARSRLEADGGSLNISAAPQDLVDEVGAWGAQGSEKALMRSLKAEFDPAGILSPGRFGIDPDV